MKKPRTSAKLAKKPTKKKLTKSKALVGIVSVNDISPV